MGDTWEKLLAERDDLLALNERLTRERDGWRTRVRVAYQTIGRLHGELSALSSAVVPAVDDAKRLREALRVAIDDADTFRGCLNEMLAADGSRGNYNAVRLAEAREAAEDNLSARTLDNARAALASGKEPT